LSPMNMRKVVVFCMGYSGFCKPELITVNGYLWYKGLLPLLSEVFLSDYPGDI
jgi:hypothetical protein